MNRHDVIAIITVAIVCLAAGYWLALPTHKATAPEGGAIVSVVSVRDTASSQIWRATGEYPQFGNVSSSFNGAIAEFVNSNLAQFKQSSEENWQARLNTMPSGAKNTLPAQSFYFVSRWEPEQINNKYISVIVRINYFNGGANETQLLKTFDYDMAGGKAMALADLFPNVPTYLQQIAQLAQQELQSSLDTVSNGHVAKDMLQAGTAPTADNYSNFTFNDDVVDLYFAKYQVAPGVFGEQKVGIVRLTVK